MVIRNGKVLLVRDRHKHDYSMPGGGFKTDESTIVAGIRELMEELRLKTVSAKRLRYCDFKGKRAYHKVCLITVEGEPHINRHELSAYIWWDMRKHIPLQGHVK